MFYKIWNAKGTLKERPMNLKIIEWKTGGRADMSARQTGVSGLLKTNIGGREKCILTKLQRSLLKEQVVM